MCDDCRLILLHLTLEYLWHDDWSRKECLTLYTLSYSDGSFTTVYERPRYIPGISTQWLRLGNSQSTRPDKREAVARHKSRCIRNMWGLAHCAACRKNTFLTQMFGLLFLPKALIWSGCFRTATIVFLSGLWRWKTVRRTTNKLTQLYAQSSHHEQKAIKAKACFCSVSMMMQLSAHSQAVARERISLFALVVVNACSCWLNQL